MSIVLRLLTHDGGMHDEIIRDLDGSPAILGSDAGALAGTKPANLTLLFMGCAVQRAFELCRSRWVMETWSVMVSTEKKKVFQKNCVVQHICTQHTRTLTYAHSIRAHSTF
jgi:hypothetical protein